MKENSTVIMLNFCKPNRKKGISLYRSLTKHLSKQMTKQNIINYPYG